MKRVIIFGNGELADTAGLKLRKDDLLIGVDGGTEYIIKLGQKPDLIIGDMDSLDSIPDKVRVIRKNDQDHTDMELALSYCRENEVQEVMMVGFLGRRLDHMIANIMNLAKNNIKIKIIEGNQELFIVKETVEIQGKVGDLVSLIPLLGDCSGVRTNGLRWGLQGRILQVGRSLGVSNVMLGNEARISLKSGCLLVIHTFSGLRAESS